MTETKHTPTPWNLHKAFYGKEIHFITAGPNYNFICDLFSAEEIRIGPDKDHEFTPNPNAAANAEFIARACNSHDDLVVALKRWLEPYNGLSLSEVFKRCDPATWERYVYSQAALAKAQET